MNATVRNLLFGILLLSVIGVQFFYVRSQEILKSNQDTIIVEQQELSAEQQELLDRLEKFMNRGGRYTDKDAEADKNFVLMIVQNNKEKSDKRFIEIIERLEVLEAVK